MKPYRQVATGCRAATIALVLSTFLPALALAQPRNLAANSVDQAANAGEASAAADLAQLNSDLGHLAALAEKTSEPEQQAEAQARFAEMREKAEELRNHFDRTRFEALRSELKSETDRVVAWNSNRPPAHEAPSGAGVTVSVGSEELADAHADASAQAVIEVQQAIARLDEDIGRIAAEIDAATDVLRKDELAQLQQLEARRAALAAPVPQPRFASIVAESDGD